MHHDFDAANQVLCQVYHVAGNVISEQRTSAYNDDGHGTTTLFAPNLAAPLS
jgi:hypothetical protein